MYSAAGGAFRVREQHEPDLTILEPARPTPSKRYEQRPTSRTHEKIRAVTRIDFIVKVMSTETRYLL
jgi:hypothetical protein